MRKILFRILMVIFLFNISFSLSDYYKKVYILKVNKTELFTAINASDKQRNELNKIFAKYQKNAEEVADQPFSYIGEPAMRVFLYSMHKLNYRE